MGFFKKSEVKKNYEFGKDRSSNPSPSPSASRTLTPTMTGKDLGSGNFAVVKSATKTSANKQADM